MSRSTRLTVGTLLTVTAMVFAGSTTTASARTAGAERFDGFLVSSGASGQRHIVESQVTARGVFDGFGRIVEVSNRPGDPDTVSRDDLVFRVGSLHLKSVKGKVVFHLNRRTCAFHVTVDQTGTVHGGTGRFAHAVGRFTGSVDARGVAARDQSGRCSMAQAPLLEVDVVSGAGTLTL